MYPGSNFILQSWARYPEKQNFKTSDDWRARGAMAAWADGLGTVNRIKPYRCSIENLIKIDFFIQKIMHSSKFYAHKRKINTRYFQEQKTVKKIIMKNFSTKISFIFFWENKKILAKLQSTFFFHFIPFHFFPIPIYLLIIAQFH